MNQNSITLKEMLPYGAVTAIAKRLGISIPAVSQALKNCKPNHPAVQEAVRMAECSGAATAAKALATLASAK